MVTKATKSAGRLKRQAETMLLVMDKEVGLVLDAEMPASQRRAYLRRMIERKTGRPLGEVVGELYRRRSKSPAKIACACTQLAGENVDIAVVEHWLYEFRLAGKEERWVAMAPRVKDLLERLIEEEVARRLHERDR